MSREGATGSISQKSVPESFHTVNWVMFAASRLHIKCVTAKICAPKRAAEMNLI